MSSMVIHKAAGVTLPRVWRAFYDGVTMQQCTAATEASSGGLAEEQHVGSHGEFEFVVEEEGGGDVALHDGGAGKGLEL